jgi:hypothetical protein
MVTRVCFSLAALAIVIIMAGCSTLHDGAASLPERQAAQFKLNVWPESMIDGASVDGSSLSVEDQGQSVLVDINVSAAQGLKALYCDIVYDPALYRPMVVEPTSAMGSKSDLLQLASFRERGRLYYGQVLANYDWRPGLTGDATAAQVLFLKQPAANLRTVSAVGPPIAPSASTLVAWDIPTRTLSWRYASTGDYDQNGQVTIADLTPLGATIGQSVVPDSFPEHSRLSMIDGDGNGEINIADLVPLGNNFMASALGGYNIYKSLSIDDIPATPNGPNGAGASLVGNVPFAAATGDLLVARKAFSSVVETPEPNTYFWVRPSDGTADGTPSNAVLANPPAPAELTLATLPAAGTGSTTTPYRVLHGADYTLSLIDPLAGEVSSNPATIWVVTPPEAGAVDQSGEQAVLHVGDEASGAFTLSGEFDDVATDPAVFNFEIMPVGLALEIYPDPADTDWPVLSPPDGGSSDPFYLMPNDDAIEFSFLADDDSATIGLSGYPVDVNMLTWTAFPAPFLVTWITPGTFTSNQFTNCYIIAQDDTPLDSNKVYVQRREMP